MAGTGCNRRAAPPAAEAPAEFTDPGDFLEDLGRRTFRYFIEAAHPGTGHVLDRRRADGGPDSRRVASIAATGFGLSALVVGDRRGWAAPADLKAQALRTLRHLRSDLRAEHGFYFHFHDWETGERVWNCEVSSIDTAILMCGVLMCRAHFEDPEVAEVATELYERVDWPWMLNGGETLSMGWLPEKGFLPSRWDHYCELMMLYLLALGSPTHPIPPACWKAWSRPLREYYGERYIWSPAPLFVHQFSHAWFDFRNRTDDGVDWFANSVAATKAHLRWSLERAERFPRWSEDLWGVTSSDSEKGYVAWGGPPDSGPLDGTIVPCAAAGSLPFLPDACLRTLQHQRAHYGRSVWRKYGFVDAFNPHTGWVNPDVIGIDLGITLLMLDNHQTGGPWHVMAKDPAVSDGFTRAGFV